MRFLRDDMLLLCNVAAVSCESWRRLVVSDGDARRMEYLDNNLACMVRLDEEVTIERYFSETLNPFCVIVLLIM
jgi:hypothetical protein